MAKSKSFKSLTDLKDLDLFALKDGEMRPQEKGPSHINREHLSSTQIPTYNKAPSNTHINNSGTPEQEESYLKRKEWITKREYEVSLAESNLSLQKKNVESKENELNSRLANFEKEKTAHQDRLNKLETLENFEKKLLDQKIKLETRALSIDKKMASITTKEKNIEQILKAAKKNENKLIKENMEVKVARANLEKKYIKLSSDFERISMINVSLQKDLKATKQILVQSEKQIELLEENNVGRPEEYKIKLDDWDLVTFITANGASASSLGYSNKKIAICGDGPWLKKDFEYLIKSKGFIPVSAGNPNAEVAIVGRDFNAEEVESQLIAREQRKIHFYSQELLIASIAAKQNPLDKPSKFLELLDQFSVDHPGLKFLMENFEFPWPMPNISDSVTLIFTSDGLVDQSPLVSVGYRVGIERGLLDSQRRNILSNAFNGDYDHQKNWHVHSDEYMARWGTPKSRKRLFQMSHHIHALITSRRGNPSMKYAVQDWKKDLSWLKKFYKPYMGFKWPY